MTSLSRIARGLAALAILTAFVAGTPLVLLTVLDADPRRLLPDGPWPPLADLPAFLWHRLRWALDTGDLVIGVLTALGWAAWLGLVWITLAEIAYQARHGIHTARHGLANMPPRRWIAGLITGITLLATSTPTAAGAPAARATATVVKHPPAPDVGALNDTGVSPRPPLPPATPGAVPLAEPTSPTARCPRVPVVHGDTLWGLAERHLANPGRWREIADLNRDLLSAAGPDHLEPGWELLLPPDATHLPDTAHPASRDTRRTVTVRRGDSLSSIATRELGTPERWHEIYTVNYRQPQPQPDCRALTNPDLLLPGWKLHIPTGPPDPDHPTTADAGTGVADPPRDTPTGSRDDHATARELVEPEYDRAPAPADPDPGTGISLPSGGYVGLGLAALITALAMTVRLWRRRAYRPGSGNRDDPDRAPVVRALRLAHDQNTGPHDSDGAPIHPTSLASTSAEAAVRERARATAAAVLPPEPDTVVGVRSAHAVALDLARTRGLGLVGPGASAVARALLVTLLTPRDTANTAPSARVIVPASDLEAVLATAAPLEHPPRVLRIATDLDAALDDLETELLARRRDTGQTSHPSPGTLVLLATTSAHANQRLRDLLDQGADYGLAGVLLGQWRPGGTAHVLDDGTVSATSSNLADPLDGTRLFTLPVADATALLDLLRMADDTAHDYDPRAADPDTFEVGTDASAAAGDATASPDATTDAVTRVETETPADAVPDADPKAAYHAASVVQTPSAVNGRRETGPVMTLCVLGRPHLYYRADDHSSDLIEAVSPKQREVLTYLALHRTGSPSDAITAAIWPGARGRRPQNTFHVTVSQLRKSIRTATGDGAPDVIVVHDGYYTLNPDHVSTDLWQLQDLLRDARRADDNAQRRQTLERIVELSPGYLGADITAEWIERPREALRRDVLDAISALIHTLGQGRDDRKLALLELARGLDKYNEAIYRDIARTLARLGHSDAILRTRKLLTDTLAEIDERPRRDTIALMESLQRAAEMHSVPPGADSDARAATAPAHPARRRPP